MSSTRKRRWALRYRALAAVQASPYYKSCRHNWVDLDTVLWLATTDLFETRQYWKAKGELEQLLMPLARRGFLVAKGADGNVTITSLSRSDERPRHFRLTKKGNTYLDAYVRRYGRLKWHILDGETPVWDR